MRMRTNHGVLQNTGMEPTKGAPALIACIYICRSVTGLLLNTELFEVVLWSCMRANSILVPISMRTSGWEVCDPPSSRHAHLIPPRRTCPRSVVPHRTAAFQSWWALRKQKRSAIAPAASPCSHCRRMRPASDAPRPSGRPCPPGTGPWQRLKSRVVDARGPPARPPSC